MEVVNTARARQHIAESERLVRESEGEEGGKEDTWVFPLVQMKPLGIQVDEEITRVVTHTHTHTWTPLPSPTNIQQITPIACDIINFLGDLINVVVVFQ